MYIYIHVHIYIYKCMWNLRYTGFHVLSSYVLSLLWSNKQSYHCRANALHILCIYIYTYTKILDLSENVCTSDLDSLFISAPDVFALCENMCKSDFETPVGGEIKFATRAYQLCWVLALEVKCRVYVWVMSHYPLHAITRIHINCFKFWHFKSNVAYIYGSCHITHCTPSHAYTLTVLSFGIRVKSCVCI